MKTALSFLPRLLVLTWIFLGLTTLDASAQRNRKAKTEKPGRKKSVSGKKSVRKETKADKKRQQVEVANPEGNTRKAARKRGNGEKKEEKSGTTTANRSQQVSISTPRKLSIDDKTIGKDDKGRPVYETPKGGRYYVNANGEKIYLSADKN